jgi:hypothetical protein
MRLGKALGILISSSLLLASGALAAGSSEGASRKGDHAPPKTPPAAVRHLKPQAPIVMGRSVTLHRKTKLHHVKVNPPESDAIHADSQL